MGSFDDEFDLSDEDEESYDNQNENTRIVTRNQSALKHYGILGMKWGRRKGTSHLPTKLDSNAVGAIARTGQSAASLGQTVTRGGYNHKTLKKAKTLSDDELKKLTSRLNLENNFMDATTKQTGRGKVEGILSTAGATLALVSSAAVMVDAINRSRK